MKYLILGTLTVLTTSLCLTATIARSDMNSNSPSTPVNPPAQVPSKPIVTAPPVMLNNLELAIYNRVNQYRQTLDLPPLEIDPIISVQAKIHSQEMAQTGNLSHDGFKERVESFARVIPYRNAGENVATCLGFSSPDEVVMKGWIESEGHHRNMIGRYDLTGIGVVRNAKGEYYFTQIFVRQRSK